MKLFIFCQKIMTRQKIYLHMLWRRNMSDLVFSPTKNSQSVSDIRTVISYYENCYTMTFGGDYGYKKQYNYYCKSARYHAHCSKNHHHILIWKSWKCCIRSSPHVLLSFGGWQSWGNTSPGKFAHEFSMLSSHSWSSAVIYLSLPWVVQFHEAGSTCLISVWLPLRSIYSCTNCDLCTIVCHIPSCWELTQFLYFIDGSGEAQQQCRGKGQTLHWL